MKINILATAATLSDHDLLVHLDALAGRERNASVELVAHLAALDCRPALYAGRGYGSLFGYCTQALRLSEDAACNRIEAARACRRFPVILDLLSAGSMTLTSVRILGRHLTPENHAAVLEKAKGGTRHQIEALVAELAPRPDVASSVRKLPAFTNAPSASAMPVPAATAVRSEPDLALSVSPSAFPQPARPIVQATAPERYRVQFTVGQQTHDKLRRVQALLRREIPDGDPGAIFDRALTLLLAKVEKTKLGAAERPTRSIRPGTDSGVRTPEVLSRYIPRHAKRTVWSRGAGQCAFVSPDGRRCSERTFLEFHHLHPHAKRGRATVANVSLRCRRHNQYESLLVFGPYRASADKLRCSIRTPPPWSVGR